MKMSRGLWYFAILYTLGFAGSMLLGFRLSSARQSAAMLVLSTPDTINESVVLERLSDGGCNQVVSESSQWVYVDDFEGPKAIPLKDYYTYIEPLDPRNDGYADVLKTIFVSNGMRRYFITIQGQYPWNSADALIKRLEKILETVHPTFQLYMADVVAVPWWFIGLILIGILIYTAWKLRYKQEVLLSLPASLILLPSGPGSLLSSGLLVALQICLGQFQKDILIRYYHHKFDAVGSLRRWYKASLIYGIGLIVIYLLNSYIFNINWFSTISALVVHCATGIIVILLRLSFYHEIDHRAFLPIDLVSSIKKHIDPLQAIIPFACGAIGVSILLLIIPGSPSINQKNKTVPIPLTIEQYQTHLDTQASFSITSLHSNALEGYAYTTFRLDSDGLLSSEKSVPLENTYLNLAMPPLETLLTMNGSDTIHHETIGHVVYLMIVIVGVLILMYRASHGTLLLMYKSGYLDKRIAA